MESQEINFVAAVDLAPTVIPNEPVSGLANEGQSTSDSGQPTKPSSPSASTAKIMMVDDEPINVKVVRKHLMSAGYPDFVGCSDSTQAVEMIRQEQPDAILLDIMMPKVSGLEILQQVRANEAWVHLPVIILTASDDEETKVKALEIGATDFLGKPVNFVELVPRLRNALLVKAHHDHLKCCSEELQRQVRRRTAELLASRLELIHCLARAAEYRDNETGRHVVRVGRYVGVIARQLGMDDETVELLQHAAPLHDMGKVGIPDAILLKPGKLDPEEFELMKKHTGFGKKTFEPMSPAEWTTFRSHTFLGELIMDVDSSPIIAIAAKIALTHHEKWDGTGYPLGLAGEDIPLAGRITAVADVFDALSSSRPYKEAFPIDKCFEIMKEGRGSHFDPKVLDAFLASREEIVNIRIDYADVD